MVEVTEHVRYLMSFRTERQARLTLAGLENRWPHIRFRTRPGRQGLWEIIITSRNGHQDVFGLRTWAEGYVAALKAHCATL
jgi:hypothetical protein